VATSANFTGIGAWQAAVGKDNLNVVAITYVPDLGTALNLGTTTVLATATDLFGLVATCTFKITVVPPASYGLDEVLDAKLDNTNIVFADEVRAARRYLAHAPRIVSRASHGCTAPHGSPVSMPRAISCSASLRALGLVPKHAHLCSTAPCPQYEHI